MNTNKKYELNNISINFNQNEIELLKYLTKYPDKVAKFVAKKCKLLEPGLYGIQAILETINEEINKSYKDEVNDQVKKQLAFEILQLNDNE